MAYMNQEKKARLAPDISGDDIAKELNELERQAARQFLKDHVQFVVIR